MSPASSRSPSGEEVDRFRGAVAECLGLQFDDDRVPSLGEALSERMRASDCDAATYLARLQGQGGRAERGLLAERLTVGETYFLRNPDHFRAFVEVVLPERMRARSAARRLRILSAGCATGEEAFTLAILLSEQVPELATWDARVVAIDLNPSSLRKAAAARYSIYALRGLDEERRSRWFHAQGREFVLDRAIPALVTFEERNLVDEDPDFWLPGSFDVVLCRNVVMYFTPQAIRAVVARIARALTPGGYLFLGHAETLRGVSQSFDLVNTHETFYYRLRDENSESMMNDENVGALPPPVPALPELGGDESWVDAIRRASERIASLAAGRAPDRSDPRATTAAPPTPPPPPNAPSLDLARELFRQERFADALELLDALSPAASSDPDAQLLRAALLANRGDLPAAERVCRALLTVEERNAGAHYLMALCREHAGDREGASRHGHIAISLDPNFAMAHLQLGLLARRAGDFATARRELGEALELLGGEEASRLLLFGGGFQREALLRLCRAALRACGGGA